MADKSHKQSITHHSCIYILRIHSGAAVLTSTLWMGRDIQYLWQKVIYTTSILTVVIILCTSKEKRLSLHAWSAETLNEMQLLPSICSYPHTFGWFFCSANLMIISFKSWDFLYLTESARLFASESISITWRTNSLTKETMCSLDELHVNQSKIFDKNSWLLNLSHLFIFLLFGQGTR